MTKSIGLGLEIFRPWPWPAEDLALALNAVVSITSGNCDNGSELSQLILTATLYLKKLLLRFEFIITNLHIHL